MKKLAFMNTISRSAHRMAFKLQKHSPEILVVAGVIGAVASAVMACKATTKLSDILDDSRDRIDSIHDVIENPDKVNKHPQNEFQYRNLAEPVYELDPEVKAFLEKSCREMMAEPHGEACSLLPYFPGYKYENGVSTYRGEEVGEGGYVYAKPGMYGNVALLDIASMHPHSTIAECLFGVRYTTAYREIVEGRVSIKHEAWDIVNGMLDGKLTKHIERVKNGELTSKDLANALKTAINSVYGLTSAIHGNIQSDLYIRNAKLEKGTVATDWTPAPEDLKTRISDAETAISNNAKEIKLKASQDEVTVISDNLKVLTKTSTEFKQTVEGWQLNWDKLISTDNAEVASHQDYITFDKGDIILGESSNDLKLKITNDSIQFKGTSNTEVTPDSDATAWITGKTFHISDGEIQNSLKFGKLYLKPNNENNSVDLYYSDSESDVISGSYVRLGQTISMGNGMGSGFLKLNTGCIQMYPTTLADTIGNGNTGKFELHAGGSYPYIIFGDYNTNDEAKKEKGRYSVRIGGSNTVSGNCSVAIGYSSDVSGKNSTAIGHYLKNISDNQLLIGKCNISSDYPFIIGNGSSDTERSNALTVDWDGNITGKSLTSANDLKLGFGSSNIFKPYFTKGDSITLTIYAVGYVTTGGKEVAMYVPLSRPIIAGGSVSVASVNGLTIRQNGKYLYSSSASNSVNPSSFRAAIVGSGCGVNIVATFGNTVNATVNDVCSITASIKITFS